MKDNKRVHGLCAEKLENRAGLLLDPACWRVFTQLQWAAKEQGFDIQIASAYRSFERQLAIWNAKAEGDRPVLDSRGTVVDLQYLSEKERVHAILRWSALPGASRHHWGTDFDIYDAAALKPGQTFALLQSECEEGGVFAPMYRWLDNWLAEQADFFRPYCRDLGGVAVEPWHLSYAPVATELYGQFDLPALRGLIEGSDIALKGSVLSELEIIVQRYVSAITEPLC